MTSTPPTEHTSRSLSESWATLSASDAHSEDGSRSEQTDAASLIDQAGPDDVASLDERYSCSEMDGNGEDDTDEEDYDDRRIDEFETQELPASYPVTGDAIEDSNITAKTAFYQPSESIEFDEPEHWPEVERVELKQTIQVIDGPEAADLKERLDCEAQDTLLTVTVQQTMTRRSLDTDKPFRVLYVGNPEFRNIILDKIGDVLVASSYSGFESSSTESSRYHVVPTAFGAGAVPNFAELLPIHVQLVVDECVRVSSDSSFDDPGAINVEFKNRPTCTSSWNGSEYTISSPYDWTIPDVAILFRSSIDTSDAVETQNWARLFMERHGIPTLVISEKPLWRMMSEPIPVNYHSLHMCLESRHPVTGKSTLLRRYPIDLETFESITPGQLNRNLASLADIYPSRALKIRDQRSDRSEKALFMSIRKYIKEMLGFCQNGNTNWTTVLRLVVLTLVSAIVITLGYSALQVAAVSFLHLSSSPLISDSVSPPVTARQASSIPSIDNGRYTSLSVPSLATQEVRLLAPQSSSRSPLEKLIGSVASVPEREMQQGKFEIHVVGDCHLVLKPPRTFINAKKQPRFDVHISRNNIPLGYELSKLFDGVYTIKLDRGDAYGVVDIALTAASKPPLKQTMSVDLGTPWLKIASWKRAAQAISSQVARDLNIAQTGLSEAYSRLCTDMQLLMGDVVRKAHFMRREAEILGPDSAYISLETRDAVLSRSKQISEAVKRSAVQPFLTASSAIQGHTGRFNREARGFMSNTWNRVSTCVHGLDLGALKSHVRNARKCEALGRAQNRAKGLMRRKSCEHLECHSQAS
ncbi:uncharacterized protein ACLA_015190 [Aspergillus clavatus NRRL 1]|uniref:Uncharacterized protein n=1 Tax=Aspergillus clavatus (strain ATCC 1007 / CBS 513.65 / DSM 816 / NCTC 3887 / NRRL 1 / QM 1276 / 107) TaxID=344612 RepID=A1CBG3_ASPCL|nr:uncharacterized protein ACLA_015190 [Aspergillus clavatus NRRL 1]EAW13081.1 conserved hypothetical protein [Aspergillus clavatus NRRL 1]